MTTTTLPARRRSSRARTTTVIAPSRFDTHQIPAIARQLAQTPANGTPPAAIDASAIQFADQDAIDFLVPGHDGAPAITIEQPSLALRITLEFLGHTPGTAALERAA